MADFMGISNEIVGTLAARLRANGSLFELLRFLFKTYLEMSTKGGLRRAMVVLHFQLEIHEYI